MRAIQSNKTGCKKIIRLGRGLWGPWDYCWDGHKYVCQDDLAEGAACLVYSFGVGGAGGATFEKAMAAGGCQVYAHDHTAQDFPDTGYGNLHFVRTGIGPVNNVTEEGELKTLDTLLRENGHTGAVINYLKVCSTKALFPQGLFVGLFLQVDVDGAELDSMIQWIQRYLTRGKKLILSIIEH